ncbi:MAG TPA: hypothetical protein VHC98_01745 [Candidatus Saccharimonadales bacterium]|nr:hypothetical protein [Candidatus Saccharimonadales bacterium]
MGTPGHSGEFYPHVSSDASDADQQFVEHYDEDMEQIADLEAGGLYTPQEAEEQRNLALDTLHDNQRESNFDTL